MKLIRYCSIFSYLYVLLAVASCNHAPADIPLPAETEFLQPLPRPLHFSKSRKFNLPENETVIKPRVRKFDFNKLPEKVFDSTGFLPFQKKGELVHFSWDKLRDTAFNYDGLPSKPLRFENFLLDPPKLVKSGHPNIKNGVSSLLYELGELQTQIGYFISSLLEDKNGYIWIGTEKGLFRYDGENLQLYYSIPEPYRFFCMLEDDMGNIWFGTNGVNAGIGIFELDIRVGIIRRISTSKELKNLSIIAAMKDHQGRIWFSTYPNGIVIVDINKKLIKYFNSSQGLSHNVVRSMLVDDKNNVWLNTRGGGVNIIDFKNEKVKYLNKKSGLVSDSTSVSLKDSSNKIWIADYSGNLNEIDIQNETIRRYTSEQGLSNNIIFTLLRDQNNNMWMGTTGNGVEIINPEKGSFKKITTLNGLNGDNVRSLLQDSHAQSWIGTSNGLNLMNLNGTEIEHTGRNEITTLAEDDQGLIWIGMLSGTRMGVRVLNRISGLARSLTSENGLDNDSLQNIIVEHNNIWIGTNNGIDIIDSARKTIKHIGKTEGLTFREESIMMNDGNNMWLGSHSLNAAAGVDVYNTQKSIVRHLDLTQELKDSAITDIKPDKSGNIWIASTTGGIYIINPENKMMKYLDEIPGIRDRNGKILLSDDQGNMWIGTDQGVHMVNNKMDSFISFSTKDGLVNDNVISLNQYKGKIYVGTRGGITIIVPPAISIKKNWALTSFGNNQGINKIDIASNSDIITSKGQFLWGDKGITILDNFKEPNTIPHVHFTAIVAFNDPLYFSNNPWSRLNDDDTLWTMNRDTFFTKDHLPANASAVQQSKMRWDSVSGPYNIPVNLKLPYFQNYLQFHYAQVNAGNSELHWFRYILLGIDKHWSDKTNNTFSQNYLNLPHGNYKFQVTCLSGGIWSSPESFSFTILPPWWQSWWAYALYIAASAGIIVSFANYRSRKLKRENIILEEKITRRTAELSQSLNELKNTQNQLIQSEKMASLGELTAGIAHEIQNPLNFVNNFSEVNIEINNELKDKINTIAITEKDKTDLFEIVRNLKENEQKINHHGKRADSIVKGMLQHSRSSNGIKEPTDINTLAEEYLRLSYHGMRNKDKSFNARLITDFDAGIGKIGVVANDFGRVLLNLYNNAFYAIADKAKAQPVTFEPWIDVSTRKLNGLIEIRIKDNGNGIPQKVLDKIFQPFFTTKPTGQGTGLGLSLSYDIIKSQGGNIKVETKEGEWAEFIITMPNKV